MISWVSFAVYSDHVGVGSPVFSTKVFFRSSLSYGGSFKPTKKKLCYGYSIAHYLARKYAPDFEATKMGRGSAFEEAQKALMESGN